MTNKAKQYYSRLYGIKWDDMKPAMREQLEQAERDKLPVKGEKRLPKFIFQPFVFSKKIINKD